MQFRGGYRSADWRLPDRLDPKVVVLQGFPDRSSRFRGESNPSVVDETPPRLPHGIGPGITTSLTCTNAARAPRPPTSPELKVMTKLNSLLWFVADTSRDLTDNSAAHTCTSCVGC